MSFTVEIAKPSDAAAISRVLERAYSVLLAPDYPANLLQVALPIISVAKPALIQSGRYFVSKLEGQVVGAGGWSAGDPREGGATGPAHIRHVATDPSVTRMGVGTGLMQAVFYQARQAGVTQMQCLSTLTAVPFYKNHGFNNPQNMEVTLAGRVSFPCVLLERNLTEKR